MSLIDTINEDFKNAMRNRKELIVATLRLLKSAIKNLEIETKKELSDNDIIDLISKEIKKRKDAEKTYNNVGRVELAEKEKKEANVLQLYMPQQLTDEELDKIIQEEINNIGASDKKDMGRVMSEVMKRVKGKADGGVVSGKVIKLLE
ncbi:aspartyl-tRNA amidotransferase [bacterium CG_4_10_14_0_2_um_filter_33_32]|nr:MAG: aspartyl-tRNA amidotransferase [bacterium CG2_30_33_46]PIR67577.1 MAG: aspartyl-tRNA amidotransferase [bacterium CG10_big_fil_rev_8_21_14_0_10_33_18]PIU76451.1 MAG: aspartyl-tRNA amidotransferase [bacterium CG06_land_8_20_14_3_00_33_50]PIW81153.1 MAG: aspartyl-tRNA amidotransferase [bacterium CG_4_8_14_3_um_filter_33_28]PIY84889.1 MAG: aspartyl-tRNA amidotransferase [bacterium CG_4_10_14_0_8_um_filter_33_57]PIZ86510.1 MAG: aspartyl-tRNA amidotransferase [bacterium CG_4_10_14_0_2_um_fil